jgi:HK97 gp10 family phage protein
MPIEFRSRIPAANALARQAISEAITETFELDIKPAAVEHSPVTEQGYAHNLELLAEHKLGGRRASGTGTNRRSIDYEVEIRPDGVYVKLFTQSGYGGYLELGTFKMPAQPYLWPAFIEFIEKVAVRAKEKIDAAGAVGGKS